MMSGMTEAHHNGYAVGTGTGVQTFHFRRYDRIVINSVNYRFEETTREGHTFVREDNGLAEMFDHAEIDRLVREETLEVHADYHHPGRQEVRQRTGGRRLDNLCRKEQACIRFRQWMCDSFLERERSQQWVTRSTKKMRTVIRDIMQELDRLNRENGAWARSGQQIGMQQKEPDPRTLRRWLHAYERGGYDPMSLRSNYRTPSYGAQLPPEAYEIHVNYVFYYASSKKPSKHQAWRSLCHYIDELNAERELEAQVKVLSRRAFERMVDRMDPMIVVAGREGRDAARKAWRPAWGGLDVAEPFQRLEMDEYKTDLQSLLIRMEVWQDLPSAAKARIPRTRVWVSAAIDACTRVVPAIRMMTEHPSEASAVTTLEMAVTPNPDVEETVGAATSFPFGTPQEVATDSGASYVAKGFQYRVQELGAAPVLPPAGIPELRGRIERVFQTFRQRILQHFSGQTFHNVVEKGDADPEADASLVVAEFNRLLTRGVLDDYHNTPHSELGGATPLTYFQRMNSFSRASPPPGGEHRRHVFGVPCQRRIAQEGLLVAGIRYQSDALQKLRRQVQQKQVDVRIDRFDISRISVWHPFSGGWLPVPARFEGLENVSYWEWCNVVRHLKRQFSDHARMAQSVVRQALRDRERQAAGAEAIAGVTTMLTETEMHRAESEVFGNFTVAPEDDESPGLGFTSAVTNDASDTEETLSTAQSPGSSAADEALSIPPDGAAALPAPDTHEQHLSGGDTNPDDHKSNSRRHDGYDDDHDDDDDLFGDPDTWTSK